MCYIASGYPALHPLVKRKQRKFFCKIWNARVAMEDDPFALSLGIVVDNQYKTKAYVNELLLHTNTNDIEMGCNELKTKLLDSNSRRTVCRDLNPNLSVDSLYNTKCSVREPPRCFHSAPCVGTVAHSLPIEVGGWNTRGRGRLLLEERTCVCGQIQTEVHVTQHCDFSTIVDLFSDEYSDVIKCEIVYQILAVYE